MLVLFLPPPLLQLLTTSRTNPSLGSEMRSIMLKSLSSEVHTVPKFKSQLKNLLLEMLSKLLKVMSSQLTVFFSKKWTSQWMRANMASRTMLRNNLLKSLNTTMQEMEENLITTKIIQTIVFSQEVQSWLEEERLLFAVLDLIHFWQEEEIRRKFNWSRLKHFMRKSSNNHACKSVSIALSPPS